MEPLIKQYDLNYETISIQAANAYTYIGEDSFEEDVGSLEDIAGYLLQLKRA